MSLITKLNPKTQSYESGGGFGSLSQSDIAAAMRGLSSLQEALVRYYMLHDLSYFAYLRDKAIIELHKKGVQQIDFIMSTVIVQDLADSTCKTCNGTGLNVKKKACGHCEGSGKKGLSDRKLAKRLGLEKSTFQRKYKQVYKEVYAQFEFIANASVAEIRKKLG